MSKKLWLILVALALFACTNPNTPTPSPSGANTPTSSIANRPTATNPPLTAAPPTAVPPPHTPLSSTPRVQTPLASPPPTTPATTEWQQLGANPQRTGYVPEQLADTWRFKWIWNGPSGSADAGPASEHLPLPKGMQPVLGNGKLFVGHTDGIVRAIAENDGKLAWATATGGELLNTGAYDPATQSVFFGSTDGRLYRLRAADGQVLGSFVADGSILMAPLLVGNTIFVGTARGSFYAVDIASLQQRWSYAAGAELIASPSFTAKYGGLVIFPSEDAFVHAVQVADGTQRWRIPVQAGKDPKRGNVSFPDTYPVVSEANDVVIIRSYFNWQQTWQPEGGAPSTIDGIRAFLTANPSYQSFFVLELNDGRQRFVAPVMGGAIGNGDDFYSAPPQAVVKRLPDGSEVAYLLWRNGQSCAADSACTGTADTTIGEMDLRTGEIRFVQDYKNQGAMRLPSDEQSTLSMAGDTLFHAHWMLLGAIRIVDRQAGLGDSYTNPIRSIELAPVVNSLAEGSCPQRDARNRFCPTNMQVPPNDAGEPEGFHVDPGFYIYYSNRRIYDRFFTPPVRSAVISNGTIYWKSVDGAIVALAAAKQ